MDGVITGLSFDKNIGNYNSAINSTNSEISAITTQYQSYKTVSRILNKCLMVFDIVMVVIFAAYFAYMVCRRIAENKEENYKLIEEALS